MRLTVLLLALIAAVVLIGAWCPQEAQVGQQKVIDMFGPDVALELSRWGVTDIFHTPLFLLLIGFLTVNMVACSVQRVFPRARLLKQPMPLLSEREISRLTVNSELALPGAPHTGIARLAQGLKRCGYQVRVETDALTAEWGKLGRLAGTVTHIGLLTLLAGVTVSSWTGFSGFQAVPLHGKLTFGQSEHSKLWIGRLPDWSVRVDATRREDYESGDPKQWYSDLSVVDSQGRVLKRQEISVNNPLSYGGVDIYQSSWGLDQLVVSFNEHVRHLDLRQMGKVYAAFLPLDEETMFIFSVHDQVKPLRLFAKRPDWGAPRLLAEIPPGKSIKLGSVNLTYREVVPVTGLQYKSDPGFPAVIAAFVFIIAGAMLAAVPHRQVWAHARIANKDDALTGTAGTSGENACILAVGGRSAKAGRAFEKSLSSLLAKLSGDGQTLAGETI